LEHLVDVAESDRSDGQTILEHEESTARARAIENWRADRDQALLSTAALDIDARHPIQELGIVGGALEIDGLSIQPAEAAREVESRFRCTPRRHNDLLELRIVRSSVRDSVGRERESRAEQISAAHRL